MNVLIVSNTLEYKTIHIYLKLIKAFIKGNPLEEKHNNEGDWRELVPNKLKKLSKLDGLYSNILVFLCLILHSII